jgi:hypothetical protein
MDAIAYRSTQVPTQRHSPTAPYVTPELEPGPWGLLTPSGSAVMSVRLELPRTSKLTRHPGEIGGW